MICRFAKYSQFPHLKSSVAIQNLHFCLVSKPYRCRTVWVYAYWEHLRSWTYATPLVLPLSNFLSDPHWLLWATGMFLLALPRSIAMFTLAGSLQVVPYFPFSMIFPISRLKDTGLNLLGRQFRQQCFAVRCPGGFRHGLLEQILSIWSNIRLAILWVRAIHRGIFAS